jgi:hypothetical protein
MAVFLFLYVVVWSIFGGLIGALIGRGKGRTAAGFWLGLLLGWIGWIVIAVTSRTPQAEASRHVAIAAATQRLTGTPPPAPTPSVRSQRSTTDILRPIRTIAFSDVEADLVTAAIDRFAADKQPQRQLSDWVFATGQFPFLARYDGQIFACNSDGIWTLNSAASAEYSINTNGDITRGSIGREQFHALRPRQNALRFFQTLRAIQTEAEPEAAPAPPTQEPAPLAAASGQSMTAASEALRGLQSLLTEGLLTQDEFDVKRRQIIDRI